MRHVSPKPSMPSFLTIANLHRRACRMIARPPRRTCALSDRAGIVFNRHEGRATQATGAQRAATPPCSNASPCGRRGGGAVAGGSPDPIRARKPCGEQRRFLICAGERERGHGEMRARLTLRIQRSGEIIGQDFCAAALHGRRVSGIPGRRRPVAPRRERLFSLVYPASILC